MRLLLAHPGVARLSCEDCEAYLVDVPITGAFSLHAATKQPQKRPPGAPTPCKSCPKCAGMPPIECTPKAGRQATLSAKNWRTIQLYFRIQGCSGAGLTMDGITRKNMGIIASELARHESGQRERFTALLQSLVSR